MRWSCFCFVLSLPALSCFAQESLFAVLDTDRPAVGTAPDVVEAHTLMVENGVGFVRGTGVSGVDGTETFLRLGVGKRTEVRMLLPNRDRLKLSPSEHWQDAAVGAKVELPARGSWRFATGLNLSMPTGSIGLSSGGIDPSVLFSVARPVSRRMWSFASATVGWFSNGSTSRKPDIQFAVDAHYALSPKATALIEWAPLLSSMPGNSSSLLQTGVMWAVRPRVQLDARAGSFIKDAGPAFVSGVGFSFLLGRPRVSND